MPAPKRLMPQPSLEFQPQQPCQTRAKRRSAAATARMKSGGPSGAPVISPAPSFVPATYASHGGQRREEGAGVRHVRRARLFERPTAVDAHGTHSVVGRRRGCTRQHHGSASSRAEGCQRGHAAVRAVGQCQVHVRCSAPAIGASVSLAAIQPPASASRPLARRRTPRRGVSSSGATLLWEPRADATGHTRTPAGPAVHHGHSDQGP